MEADLISEEENENVIPSEVNDAISPVENNRPRHAGKVKILGILWPVLQVCVAIGVQVVVYSVEELSLEVGLCVTGVYMILSIVLMIFYFVWQKLNGEDICEEGESHHSNAHLLAGLYIFGTGTLLYSMLQIAGIIDCGLKDYKVIYPSATLLFAIFQMLCLHAFINKTMRYHWLLVFSWCSFLGTNFSSYIANTVMELHLISENNTNITNHSCHGKIYEFGIECRESLVSFVSEFNIISSGIIAIIMYNIVTIRDANGAEHDEDDEQNHAPNDCNLFFRSQPGITFGIFFGVLTTASTGCVVLKYVQNTDLVYFSVSIVTLTILVVIFALMQYSIRNHEIKMAVHTDDILLYISVVGILVEDFAILYSAGHSIHRGEILNIAWCTLLTTLLELCFAIFQVFILIQYLHLKRKIAGTWSKQFLYFTLIQNLTYWAIDNFVYLKDDTSYRHIYPTLDFYGEDYEKMASVANVFEIFFHFHSAVIAYEITSTKLL